MITFPAEDCIEAVESVLIEHVWHFVYWNCEGRFLMITLEVKCLSGQTRGVRVNFRFNQVSSWWRHNHILENVWRLLSWQYQFHLQNTYTFCVRMCCKKTKSLFEYNTIIHDGVVMCNDIISDIFEKLHVKEYMHRNYVEIV